MNSSSSLIKKSFSHRFIGSCVISLCSAYLLLVLVVCVGSHHPKESQPSS